MTGRAAAIAPTAVPMNNLHPLLSIFILFFILFLPSSSSSTTSSRSPTSLLHILRATPPQSHYHYPRRHSLSYNSPPSSAALRDAISQHRVQLARLRQAVSDAAHERQFLSRALQLKRGQRTIQDGQNKLTQVELADKQRELDMYRAAAPKTLQRYNDLIRKQHDLQQTLHRLLIQSDYLASSRQQSIDRFRNLDLRDVLEAHVQSMPSFVAIFVRKLIAVSMPAVHSVQLVFDTNAKLVAHVSQRIDNVTHISVSSSPFMAGILYYCILLIPVLTILFVVRVLFFGPSSHSLSTTLSPPSTATAALSSPNHPSDDVHTLHPPAPPAPRRYSVVHVLIMGNVWFTILSVASGVLSIVLRADPLVTFFTRYPNAFIFVNLMLAMYYIWHLAMLFFSAALRPTQYNIAHLLATLAVGMHYFLFSWRNIFIDTQPHMFCFNYLLYSTIFTSIAYDRCTHITPKQLIDAPPLFVSVYHCFVTHANDKQITTRAGIGVAFAAKVLDEIVRLVTATPSVRDKEKTKQTGRRVKRERERVREKEAEREREKVRLLRMQRTNSGRKRTQYVQKDSQHLLDETSDLSTSSDGDASSIEGHTVATPARMRRARQQVGARQDEDAVDGQGSGSGLLRRLWYGQAQAQVQGQQQQVAKKKEKVARNSHVQAAVYDRRAEEDNGNDSQVDEEAMLLRGSTERYNNPQRAADYPSARRSIWKWT